MEVKTSIENRNNAYFQNIEKLSQRRKTVYKLIENYGQLTAQEIKEKMVLGINQVSGRISELQELFLIKSVASKINNRSNKKNTVWSITTKNERNDLINAKYVELRNKRDILINDLNLKISKTSKYLLKKEINKINTLISNLEKLCS